MLKLMEADGDTSAEAVNRMHQAGEAGQQFLVDHRVHPRNLHVESLILGRITRGSGPPPNGGHDSDPESFPSFHARDGHDPMPK